MLIQRAFKTELEPNKQQIERLEHHVHTSHFAYNWALGIRKAEYDAWQALPEETRPEKFQPTKIADLKKLWHMKKRTEPEFKPYMLEVSTYCMQSALDDLDQAYKNAYRKLKEGKPVKDAGFPVFKKWRSARKSSRIYGSIIISHDRIQIPNLKVIKLKEKGYLPTANINKINNVTVSERAGRWFVSVSVEMEIDVPERVSSVVGVDLGIKNLAVCSDGLVIANPRAYARSLRKQKKLQQSVSRKKEARKQQNLGKPREEWVGMSANEKKAQRKFAKAAFHTACIRQEALHQATHKITGNHSHVVMENLRLTNMLKNRRLSRSLADCGLSELRRQMEYKVGWRGGSIQIAPTFYPSSKTCSKCGFVKKILKLSERKFRCDDCGIVLDRDLNAAYNLANLAKTVAHRIGETLNDCG